MVLRLVLIFFAYSLDRENRVLRTAVSFFPDAGLLAPEIAVNRIALRHFVVAIALGEIHASAIGEFPQHRQHLPLDVGGRTLLRIAEKNLVLDLQTAQLGIEYVQLFVDRHRYLRSQCRSVDKARASDGLGTEGYGTKVRSEERRVGKECR